VGGDGFRGRFKSFDLLSLVEKSFSFIVSVKNLHLYEISEIIAIPIVATCKPYLDWIESEVR